jgi:hypothetical protein
MPFCPECKYEYNPDVTTCPDCGAKLVESLAAPATEEPISEEWVRVFTAQDEMEARIVKSLLEDAGIAVWDKSDVIHSLKVYTVGPLAPEELLVFASRADDAREIIARALKEWQE